MVVGINVIFDNVVRYLRKNYPDSEDISMPYCALSQEILSDETYYRAQVSFKRKTDVFTKTAILKANPENGTIYWFKEGYTWQNWL